jgi:hypothetical protein
LVPAGAAAALLVREGDGRTGTGDLDLDCDFDLDEEEDEDDEDEEDKRRGRGDLCNLGASRFDDDDDEGAAVDDLERFLFFLLCGDVSGGCCGCSSGSDSEMGDIMGSGGSRSAFLIMSRSSGVGS